MSATSNADQVINRFVERIGSKQITKTLADDLALVIGGAIHERAYAQIGPDGQSWIENAPSTIARKGHDHVGIGLDEEMLAEENFTTDYTFSRREFALRYSGPVDKLGWFEGDNRYGIERKVWGLDDEIRGFVQDVLAEHFGGHGD